MLTTQLFDEKSALELGDIFRLHGPAYLTTFGDSLSYEQKKALSAIGVCRTAALGGHVDQCDQGGYRKISYCSAAIAIARSARAGPDRDGSSNAPLNCCRSSTSM